VLYTNVRSITSGTKREELQVLIKTENVDVVGITETWGRVDILYSNLEIPGFKLFRKDRAAVNDKKGVVMHCMLGMLSRLLNVMI